MSKAMPIDENVGDFLRYDPASGELFWLVTRGRTIAGSVAGTIAAPKPGKTTYVCVACRRRRYQAHRVAWFLQTGEQPPEYIDHVDADGTNNRWANLRAATATENNANRRTGRPGMRGVCYVDGIYRASIKVNRQTTYLGSFGSAAEAHAAYAAMAREVFGEFARFD